MTLSVRSFCVFFCLAFCTAFAFTQTVPSVQADRVAARPDLRGTATLPNHLPGWAVGANDRGAVPADTPIRLTFVLSRSAELQASFTQLLADQQNPSSANYHQWLTPQQVGERFGPTQHDLDAFAAWLSSQGLMIVETAPSRMFVSVSGPASMVGGALATTFHSFSDSGKIRMSANSDPSIPTAFASIVTSIFGLSDSGIRSMVHATPMAMTREPGQGGSEPQYTTGSTHFVTPGDFATIFDLKPVYNAGIKGSGQKVAIIGRSRVVATDISEFETLTALGSNVPNTIIPPNGSDPGLSGDDDQSEATLDVERVIGTAPSVKADLVVSGSAGGYDGIAVASQYEVQTLLDPVMTISFGSCEFYDGPSGVVFWDTLFSQAASEGISAFVSAGDSGAAGCDTAFAPPPAYQFLSVSSICVSSYVTCVGGTEFVDGPGYWSPTNGTGLSSALEYIPEGAWNEPQIEGITDYVVASGGGGASLYIAKPSWQTGAGVPADGARDVPDVSFPSATHDGYYGCYATAAGDCASGYFEFFAGTSAAAPGMAAIAALLDEKTGVAQGNLNPLIYLLAASTPNAFHDANPSTINGTYCSLDSASICNNSTPSTYLVMDGQPGYALTTGYDQATGLGSLDVANFINGAAAIGRSSLKATALSVRTSSATISDTQTATFTATLTAKTSGTPTGTVQFYANASPLGAPVTLVSGVATTAAVPFPAAGSYLIAASYSGDGTFATTTAPGVALTVTGLASVTSVTVANTAVTVGTSATFNVAVSAGSGSVVPTGVVQVNLSGPGVYIPVTVPLVNGVATTQSLIFPTPGNYTVSASYHGDSVYSASNGNGPGISVQKLPTNVSLVSFFPSIGIGGEISYEVSLATFAESSPAPNPTGSMQLYANGVAAGAPFSVSAQSQLSPYEMFPSAGTYMITASYTGDSYWAPATTQYPVTVTVSSTPASYTVAAAASSYTLVAGNTDFDSVVVASQLGFVGTVNLSCSVTYNGTASGVVAPTCSLANGTMMVAPNSPATATLSIGSVARSSATARGGERPSQLWADWSGGAEVALCGLMLWVLPRRRRLPRVLAMMVVCCAAMMGISGCGGTHPGSSTTTPPPPVAGTTAGSYTVTITSTTTQAGAAAVAPVTVAVTIS